MTKFELPCRAVSRFCAWSLFLACASWTALGLPFAPDIVLNTAAFWLAGAIAAWGLGCAETPSGAAGVRYTLFGSGALLLIAIARLVASSGGSAAIGTDAGPTCLAAAAIGAAVATAMAWADARHERSRTRNDTALTVHVAVAAAGGFAAATQRAEMFSAAPFTAALIGSGVVAALLSHLAHARRAAVDRGLLASSPTLAAVFRGPLWPVLGLFAILPLWSFFALGWSVDPWALGSRWILPIAIVVAVALQSKALYLVYAAQVALTVLIATASRASLSPSGWLCKLLGIACVAALLPLLFTSKYRYPLFARGATRRGFRAYHRRSTTMQGTLFVDGQQASVLIQDYSAGGLGIHARLDLVAQLKPRSDVPNLEVQVNLPGGRWRKPARVVWSRIHGQIWQGGLIVDEKDTATLVAGLFASAGLSKNLERLAENAARYGAAEILASAWATIWILILRP